jgi:hypothetical protein
MNRLLYPLIKVAIKLNSSYQKILLLTTYKIVSIFDSRLTLNVHKIIGGHHREFRCNGSDTDRISFLHILRNG